MLAALLVATIPQVMVVLGFWTLALLIAANLIGSQRLTRQQGRYLFSILPFIPLLIGTALSRSQTSRIMARVLPLAVVVMLILDGAGATAMRKAAPHLIEDSPGFSKDRLSD